MLKGEEKKKSRSVCKRCGIRCFRGRCLADSNRRARFCRPVTKPLIQGTISLFAVQRYDDYFTLPNKLATFFVEWLFLFDLRRQLSSAEIYFATTDYIYSGRQFAVFPFVALYFATLQVVHIFVKNEW